MKNIKSLISKTLYFIIKLITSLVVFATIVLCAFIIYVKTYTLDISFLVDYLKKEQIVDDTTNIKKLTLKFEKSFIIVAKDVDIQSTNISANITQASIELSKSSILNGQLAAKRINIINSEIYIDIDSLLEKQNPNKDTNKKSNGLKQISYLTLAKWTKYAEIIDSKITVKYNGKKQNIQDINLSFYKSNSSIDFAATGIYQLNNNKSNIKADIHIENIDSDIELKVSADNLKLQDLIKSFAPNDAFNINGTANINLNASINQNDELSDIKGIAKVNQGFVDIANVYKQKLEFKNIQTNFNYNINKKIISFEQGDLLDIEENNFNFNGQFDYSQQPTLNITTTIANIDLPQAFKYIPDLEFKTWVAQNIYAGDISNVSFNFNGPFSEQLDGIDNNPYFNISADFKNLKMHYLDDLPEVENATGKFNMLKKNIDITIDSAATSKQSVERASVDISPLFEDTSPLITIKTLSKGSVEDVLSVLNKKLDLKQDELFTKYSGNQETQATLILNLDELDSLDTDNQKFIKVDVRADITDIIGVEPAFNQRFKANNAVVNLTENSFILNANGLVDENPFTVIMKEDLLNFGNKTDLNIKGKFDSYILKEYLDIPGFNLTGVLDADVNLKLNKGIWNFDVQSNIKDSLLNFELLNYTKPLTKDGLVKANGFYDTNKSILNLENANINFEDAKINGSANIILNDLAKSTLNLNNVIIKDKTNLDKLTLKNKNLEIIGKSFDVRPFTLSSDENTSQNPDSKNDSIIEKSKINKVNIKLDTAYLDDDHGSLTNVIIDLNLNNTITGIIKAQENETSQDFYIKLTPSTENANIINVESLMPNIGSYLKKVDVYDKISNGHAIISGNIMYKNNTIDSANFKVDITKFQLLKAPLLAKVLASISLEQLFTDKKGILFDEFKTDIIYTDNIIKFQKSKLRGPSIGALFKGAYDLKTKTTDITGTLVPIVKLNSVVSNIPVLGYILTGSQGALSGADFTVHGTNGKQSVNVSPLSVITPGIVKDLFESVSSIVKSDEESKAITKARKKANIEMVQ
jgi:hypothetical protein